MGAVYLAHDTQLDRRVALKIPNISGPDSPVLLERFYREARAAATLNHPNLCPVHDVGQHQGIPYLTMAYLEGKPLSALLVNGQPLSQRQAAMLVRMLATALQEAHQRGVVHRDLKPANIMMTVRKQPVIMDFGLAQRGAVTERPIRPAGPAVPGDIRLTQTGTLLGTPAYMAPEQIAGDSAAMGPSCDIYSLGVILYELLAGRLPFQGNLEALIGQILLDDPPPPSQFRPDLDAGLEAICLKALAKKPADRYGTMSAFATALSDHVRGTAAAAAVDTSGRPGPEPALASLFSEMAQLPAKTPARPRPASVSAGQRWLILGGGGAALVLLTIGIAFFLGKSSRPTSVATTSEARAALARTTTRATEPVKPQFQLLPVDPLTVKTGRSQTFAVHIERHGYRGPIRVMGKDLPEGVLLQSTSLAAEQTTVKLELTAAPVAVPAARDATLVATAEGRRHEITFRVEVEKALPPRLMPVAPVTLAGGTQRSVPVSVERRDWQGPIQLAWNNLPPGVTAQPVLLGPDKDQVSMKLTAAADARGTVRQAAIQGRVGEDLALTVGVRITVEPAVAVFRPMLESGRPIPGQKAPSPEERDKALEVIGKTSPREPAKGDRAALAKQCRELWRKGIETKTNAVARYALWDKARDCGIRARDAVLAVAISDDLAMHYDMPELNLKIGALKAISSAIPKEQLRWPLEDRFGVNFDLVEVALDVVYDALTVGDEDSARTLVKLAEETALRIAPKNGPLHQHVLARGREIAPAMKTRAELRAAATTLEQRPDDASANLTAGKFLCLTRGEWDQGLFLLARGGDATLQELARQDLANPPQPAAFRARGDAWWNQGAVQAGTDAAPYYWRACYWYERARAGLSDADRSAIDQRIQAARGAPDLGRLKPDFDAGYATHKPERFQAGPVAGSHEGGKLVLRLPVNTNWSWYIGYDHIRCSADFACRIVGRITDPRSGGWELAIPGEVGRQTMFGRIDSAATLLFLPTWDRLKDAQVPEQLIKHRAIRPHGETNTLLMVVHGRQVEVYVNGLAVRDPFTLERGLLHRLGFVPGASSWGQGTRVEIDQIQAWTGDKVPPSLAVRAALAR
jgi:hypothetical protein